MRAYFMYDRTVDVAYKLAAIARLVGDPTRARMLWSLMGGEMRPAGELALIAQVSNQTASNHLAQLRSAKLLKLQIRGRSHFYQLRDASIAKALEAMMYVANPELPPVKDTVVRSAPNLFARTCYDHLAGKLAVQITAKMKRDQWLQQKNDDFMLTPRGERHLLSLGVELKMEGASRRRYAYACLDWSERLDHIGGYLGASILYWLIAQKAIVKIDRSRAVRVTVAGRTLLEKSFDLRISMDGNTITSSRPSAVG